MSSERCGVQAEVQGDVPLAIYTRCVGHRLNLVISHSCSVAEIHYKIDKVKSCCYFFLASDKRSLPDIGKQKPLIDLCKTRWAERHNAYSHFYTSFKYIIIVLELIALGLYRNTYDEVFRTAVWDSKSKTDASGLLTGLTSFGFIVAFLTAYQLLSHLEGITVKLQSSSYDFIEAYDMIKEV